MLSLTATQTYLLVVLNAHRQRVNKDGNHDSSVEVSAANDEIQFGSESRPATLQQPFLWLRHLCITTTGAATVAGAVTVTRAVARACVAVPMLLVFSQLINNFSVTKLVVVDAVGACWGLHWDLTWQR